MLILALNTASLSTSIAIFKQSQTALTLLGEDHWEGKFNEAEKLLPAIDSLILKNGKTMGDIAKVYAIHGPGSFTGLRIGITVANTIAYLNQCELLSISAFDYWHSVGDQPVLIYAGSGGVYLSEKTGSKPELIGLKDLARTLVDKNIQEVGGDITDEQKGHLHSVKYQVTDQDFAEIMKKIIQSGLATSHEDKIIEPLYIKPPSITVSNKAKASIASTTTN